MKIEKTDCRECYHNSVCTKQEKFKTDQDYIYTLLNVVQRNIDVEVKCENFVNGKYVSIQHPNYDMFATRSIFNEIQTGVTSVYAEQ